MNYGYEENYFNDPIIAEEWIQTIENNQHKVRDEELYPFLINYFSNYKANLIVDLGCGQGIFSEKLKNYVKNYVGIDSSKTLINRAKEKYNFKNTDFMLGNIYNIPIKDGKADAVLSVNTWFHLKDLRKAAKEIKRILRKEGIFIISTVNPDDVDRWLEIYSDKKINGKKIIGKIDFPTLKLSKNVFYNHSKEDIINSFESVDLIIKEIIPFGFCKSKNGNGLFINIIGIKK